MGKLNGENIRSLITLLDNPQTMECDRAERPAALNTFRRQAHVTQPTGLTVTGQNVVRLLRLTRALT